MQLPEILRSDLDDARQQMLYENAGVQEGGKVGRRDGSFGGHCLAISFLKRIIRRPGYTELSTPA